MAQPCVMGLMSEYLVWLCAALHSLEILGPSHPISDASNLAAGTAGNPFPARVQDPLPGRGSPGPEDGCVARGSMPQLGADAKRVSSACAARSRSSGSSSVASSLAQGGFLSWKPSSQPI